jgi:hypothetical protein
MSEFWFVVLGTAIGMIFPVTVTVAGIMQLREPAKRGTNDRDANGR